MNKEQIETVNKGICINVDPETGISNCNVKCHICNYIDKELKNPDQ